MTFNSTILRFCSKPINRFKNAVKYISSFFLKITLKNNNIPVKRAYSYPQILRSTQLLNLFTVFKNSPYRVIALMARHADSICR